MSWTQRQRQRGANMVLFRPPAELVPFVLWHDVNTHLGPKRLQWRPGIDVWKDDDGNRWTAEYAGDMHWTYVRLAEALPPQLAVADKGKVRLCAVAPVLPPDGDADG
jgi:hypothetical protein